jgi:hypothetical protein
MQLWDISVPVLHSFVAEGVVVHNCYRENLEPHGWLTKDDLARTRSRISDAVWRNEYELQEPSPEGRAIDTEAVEKAWDKEQGEFGGEENTLIEIEPPISGATYYTGVDWARDSHWTVIITYREVSQQVWKRVAFERTGRLPWPTMTTKLTHRLTRYPGRCCHDMTGIGTVIDDYLVIPPGSTVEGVSLMGAERTQVFQEYIVRVEAGGFSGARITYAYGEIKFCTNKNLSSGNNNHPPDSLVADALAWRARLLKSSRGGVGGVSVPRRTPAGVVAGRIGNARWVDPRGE